MAVAVTAPTPSRCIRRCATAFWLANCAIRRSEDGLVGHRLHWHKVHVRTGHGLADGFGIVAIVFRVLAVWSHNLGRHQSHRVADLRACACPVLGPGTGIHPDETGGESGHDGPYCATGELLPCHNHAVVIYPVSLKHLLRQINPNTLNLHGLSPSYADWRSPRFPLGMSHTI
jgi:hypothetical protein